ncbi:MAG: hypothetical protein ACLTSX_11500 [Collinsella sp.]
MPAEFLVCTLGLTMFALHPVLVSLHRGGACVRRRCPRCSSHAARLALAVAAHRVAGLREPSVRAAGSTLLFSRSACRCTPRVCCTALSWR